MCGDGAIFHHYQSYKRNTKINKLMQLRAFMQQINTFEEVLNLVTELSVDQQELLISILQRRIADMRRKELASSSQEALAEFRTGNLKPQTAIEAIAELRTYLNTNET
jgi:hypothetical protein